MAVITVNSSQALTKAVQFAADGDVIKLASGVYSNLNLQDLTFSKGITITSANPLKPAVITDLRVKNCDGLTFSNLDLTNTKNIDLAFQFMNSSNLKLDNLDVSGSGSAASAMNARLMIIRDSANVQVTDSEFGYGWHGLSLLNNKLTTVQDNYFHDLRTDGVRGGGNSDLTIRSNVFTDFYPKAQDHPDAIQLWTSNTSKSATNIIIDGNVVLRGDGGPTQGIFIRDITGKMPFINVLITDNVIAGGRYNGIAISGVKNGYLGDNIVQGFADQPSGIQMQNSTGVVLQGNESTKFFGVLKGIDGKQGNSLIPIVKDQGISIMNYWMSQHPEFIKTWQALDPLVLGELHWNGKVVSVPLPGLTGGSTASLSSFPPIAVDIDDAQQTIDDTSQVSTPAGNISGTSDTVTSSGDHALAPDVENLRLTGSGGAVGDGNALDNRISGSDGDDLLNGWAGNDVVNGNRGDDVIRGGDGEDALHGNAGNDRIFGDAGGDNIRGDDGNDVLDGGAGRDTIDGGRGSDTLTGGAESDIFRFRTFETDKRDVDVITDFQRGVDLIQITDLQFDDDPSRGQTFGFIGNKAFQGNAGEIRFFDTAAGVKVQTDVDGDGVSDFEFSLRGVHSISAKDFIL